MANRFGDQELANVNRFGDTVGPPPPPPAESSPIAKAGQAFFEGIGGQAALDIIRASNRYGTPQEVAARGERGTAAAKGLVQGIVNEPGRVRQEITNALDAFVAGNPRATLHHLLTAVPLVGAPIDQAAQEFNRGAYAEGVGHTAAIVAPLAHEPIGAGLTRVAEAGADVAPRIATGARVVGAGIKAAAPEVAAASALAGTGELVGHVVPGAEWATRLAAGHLMRSGVTKGLKAAREAMGPREIPAAAAAVAETPGMILARESGSNWADLSATDQAMLESIAKARENAAAQPAARPPTGPPQAAAPGPIVAPEAGPLAPVVTVDSSLDQLAQYWAGKDFASLSPQEQAKLHTINYRVNGVPPPRPDVPPEAGPPAAAVPPPAPPAPTPAELEAAATRPAEVGRMAPAESKADFEQRRATLAQGQPPTPGQQFAEAQGYDWAKLSADDRQALEQVAKAQANMAAQNLEVPPQPSAPPQPQTLADMMPQAPAQPEPRTLADLVPETELERQLAESIRQAQERKAAAAAAPAPAPKAENIYAKNARLAKAVRVADAAQALNLKWSDVFRMNPAELAEKVGEKSISADTIAMVVDKLRKRDNPPAAPAAEPAPTPKPPAPAAHAKR